MSRQPKISFVIPVFNSADSLAELTEIILQTSEKHSFASEIILVNDGSTDKSFETIEKIVGENNSVVVGIDLMRNFGQHNATVCGIQQSTGDFIVTMDDDLSFSPEQAFDLLDFLQTNQLDLAYGIPSENRFGLRRSIGRYLLWAGSAIGSKRIAGASFRIMTRSLAMQLNPEGDVIFIDDLLTNITSSYQYKKFDYFRKKQKSRYNGKILWRMGLKVMFFYSGFPLRMMTYLGLLGSTVSGLIGLFYIVKKLFFRAPEGYTSIIVAILFSASAVLLGIGILGEYLYRIHGNRNRTQPYFIRKKTCDS